MSCNKYCKPEIWCCNTTLQTFIFRNIQDFNMALMGSTPLFQIDAILSAPKIVMQPQSNEVYMLIMQCIRDCVESTKVGSLFLVLFSISYFKMV